MDFPALKMEMSIFFLSQNELNRVSEYLKLSLNDVFEKLVHISPTAWLCLVVCANILLFSISLHKEKDNNIQHMGAILSRLYLAYGSVFLVFSVLVAYKIRNIFFHIMRDETWINREEEEDNDKYLSEKSSGRSFRSIKSNSRVNQLHYFWDDEPQHIVAAAQFMQFGFAVPFAVLLVFNNSILIDSSSTFGWRGWFIIVPLLSYLCFVWLWCHIIPQFTQCTSLGYLVKQKHLLQIEAKLKLNTAKRKRQEEIDHADAEKKRPSNTPTTASVARHDKDRSPLKKYSSNATGSAASSTPSGSERLLKISDYVKKPTKDLPDGAQGLVNDRRRRRKTMSDGVASMRLFAPTSSAAKEALEIDDTSPKPPAPPRRRKVKSASMGVMQMRVETDRVTGENEKTTDRKDGEETNRKTTHLSGVEEGIPAWSGAVQTGTQLMNSGTRNGKKITFADQEGNLKTEDISSVNISPVLLSATQTAIEISDSSLGHTGQEEPTYLLDTIISYSQEDGDDFSDVCPKIVVLDEQQITKPSSLMKRLQTFYLSFNYRLASIVLSMVAFYVLAFRMQVILQDTCTIPDNQNNWQVVSRSGAYWINLTLLCLFMIESLTMCIIFGKRYLKPAMIIAGVFDLLLSGTCIVLLVWSELERCCGCTESNVVSNTFNDRYLAQNDTGSTCEYTAECCPTYGTRLCGGIGTIEPWVSISVLRVARFFLGKRVHKIYRKYVDGATHEIDTVEEDSNKIVETSTNYHSHSESNIEAISQLWIIAMVKHPEIVEKHGQFSGALLEAMLGIESLSTEALPKKIILQKENDKREADLLGIYPNFQSYIEAGKSMRPSNPSRARNVAGFIHESEEGSHSSNLDENEIDDFIRPACVLIRSMRRCQCKLLPLLDEWTTVDIVLTKHEIVWFDASNTRNPSEKQDIREMEAVKKAISVTKGGKGLRLCDVAIGRTVLGHMAVTDIDIVKVQRLCGIESIAKDLDGNNDEENTVSADLFQKEYWEEGEDNHMIHDPDTLLSLQENQWQQITEDRLKIHSTTGLFLFVRFFTDLRQEVFTIVTKNQAVGFAKKAGALIWCQSISHLCGSIQLKQKLPHFGEERDQELIDFVEVVERRPGRGTLNRTKSHHIL